MRHMNVDSHHCITSVYDSGCLELLPANEWFSVNKGTLDQGVCSSKYSAYNEYICFIHASVVQKSAVLFI